jgi:ankyrin repeat protein
MDLSEAARVGNLDMVKDLSDRGANLDHRDEDSMTVLMWASWNGRLGVVKELCDRGANLDIQDSVGGTAMSWAVRRNDLCIVKALCRRGARVFSARSTNPEIQCFLTNHTYTHSRIQDILIKQNFRHHLLALMCARTLPVDLLRLLHEFV